MKMKKETLLALLLLPGVGKKSVIDFIHSVQGSITEMSSNEDVFQTWRSFRLGKNKIATSDLKEYLEKVETAEKILQESMEKGIHAISILDAEFPHSLKVIKDPPVILYCRGNIDLLSHQKCIAVIGTRDLTAYGKKVTERLSAAFARSGCCIVSGLALGCDTFAHQGCLKAKGKTIAVLPSTLDQIQPAKNKGLAQAILDQDGLLVSEYYPNQPLSRGFYIERDRLQSGLSKSVVVVESDVVGGAMHTAEFALEQKKIVACFKHPENYRTMKQTMGTQKLLNDGKAIALASKEDILNLIDMVCETEPPDTQVREGQMQQLTFNL